MAVSLMPAWLVRIRSHHLVLLVKPLPALPCFRAAQMQVDRSCVGIRDISPVIINVVTNWARPNTMPKLMLPHTLMAMNSGAKAATVTKARYQTKDHGEGKTKLRCVRRNLLCSDFVLVKIRIVNSAHDIPQSGEGRRRCDVTLVV